MKRHSDGHVQWLTFDLFEDHPELVHGVFLRHGGVSPENYASLNCSYGGVDLKENVDENRRRIFRALKIKNWCELNQCHGSAVIAVNHPCQMQGDGLITELTDLGLLILHADCQAALFYDPLQRKIALTHCGWRGNVQNIYKETVLKMGQLYGSKGENILVGISPSLGPQAAEFINYRGELSTSFLPFQIRENFFDLWAYSKWQLLECGLLPHHIEIAELCTYSNSDDFFSYRRCKISGRHATVAALK